MQTAKNAAATAKESAANVAATAKSGMDKTKATVQEKVERMSAHDPMQKDMATERKQEKIHQAECNKQGARENNAAARQAIATGGAGTFTAVGRAQNSTPGAGTQGTQNYSAPGAGTQNYSAPGAGTQGTQNYSAPGAGTQGTQNYSAPGAGTQGTQNYSAGGDHRLNTHTPPTSGHNPDHLTGSNATGYDTRQQPQHTHSLGGVNTDAVYPDDRIGSGSNTSGDHGLNTHPTSGHNTGHLTGSSESGYGTGQNAHNLGGVNTAGADAVYPDDPIGSGRNTSFNTTGGDHGLNTHPTGSHNSGDLTGSSATGYGTGQNAHNLGGVNLGGADAVYPDDPIGSGPNTATNTIGGAPGTGQGTSGTYQ